MVFYVCFSFICIIALNIVNKILWKLKKYIYISFPDCHYIKEGASHNNLDFEMLLSGLPAKALVLCKLTHNTPLDTKITPKYFLFMNR